VIIEDRIREWEAGRSSSGLFCPAANSVAQIPALNLMAFQAISSRNGTMRRASASRPSAPQRTARGIFLAILNREPQFPARLMPVVPQEGFSASQFNSMSRANQPIPCRKSCCRERETSQIKSPNSVIKTHSNPMKTNDGDMLKSPKNQKTRFSLPPTFHRRDSCFSALPSPRASAVSLPDLPRIYKWSRPLLTGSAPQTEFGLTYRKQTTEKFLTGARTHISEARFCAKISVGTNDEISEEMKAIR
jgi:hypothetical protein